MIDFPERIKIIASFVEEGSYVADVGADHGLLELFIVKNRKNVDIQAIENKEGPIRTLKSALGAIKRVRISFSDGITSVDPFVDTLVLAGLGGYTIFNILNKRPNQLKNYKRIIVDAHTDSPLVRKYLTENGFKIFKEKLVKENDIYYDIICFDKTKEKIKYSDDEIEFGYQTYNDSLWKEYKKYRIRIINSTIDKILNCENQKEKIDSLKNEVKKLKKYGKEQTI